MLSSAPAEEDQNMWLKALKTTIKLRLLLGILWQNAFAKVSYESQTQPRCKSTFSRITECAAKVLK